MLQFILNLSLQKVNRIADNTSPCFPTLDKDISYCKMLNAMMFCNKKKTKTTFSLNLTPVEQNY